MSEEQNPDGFEKPERIIDDIVANLDEVHSVLVQGTQHVGYARDTFRAQRQVWAEIANSSADNPEVADIYISGVQYLVAIRDSTRSLAVTVAPLVEQLEGTSASAGMFNGVTGTTASFIPSISGYPALVNATPLPSPVQHEGYAERFSKLDPELGKVYRGISEVLYGTRAEPERTALLLIRQAYDHLFSRLAPDEDVRQSPYWSPKEGEKRNEIHREERVKYAIAKHIPDATQAAVLAASARHMLNIYKGLNRAHERSELDVGKARLALTEMRSFLEAWANALDI